ncbi:MAG: hypothetical protein RL596_1717 [Bacteroidota bacterium]|jgi:hypothetical protein
MRLFLFLLLTSFISCTNTEKKVAIDESQEKIAILKAIETETRNFYLKDHAAWSKSYVQSSKIHWVCVEPDVTLRANGWNDLSQFVATWMKENPEPMNYEKAEFKISDTAISISDNMAFVSMKGSNIQPDGKVRFTVGSRTLIKENGEWKFISMTSYPADTPDGSTGNIYVYPIKKD